MLKSFNEWTGPYLKSTAYSFSNHFLNPTLVDSDTCVLLDSIFEKLQVFENMKNREDEEEYFFYFRLPKGKAEQYMTYDEMVEDGYKIKTKEDYYRLFDKWYPKKWHWFTVTFYRSHYDGDTFYYIGFGRHEYIYAYDGKGGYKKEKEWAQPYSMLVEPLISFVDFLVKYASSSNYQSFVEKHLDYRLRSGNIPYKKYWELYPAEKNRYMKYYQGINPDDFIKFYQSGIINKESATRFEKLTANEYCKMFKIASDAVGLPYNKDKTLQENFHRNSDGRNHGLNEIEPDSTDEFDEWYKNENGWFDHTFELRGPYRIDLIVYQDDRGYYLDINGRGFIDSAYMMKIYLALKNSGINAYMYSPKDLIDDYLGDSLHEARSCELYGGNFPKKKIREYIRLINWDELRLIKVKKHESNYINQERN